MAYLKNLYIFEGFGNDFLENIKKASQEKKYSAGTIIFREKDIANEAYILISGIVSVIIGGKTVNTIFEGDIFGEIGLVLNEPRTATIQAETDINVLIINKETLSQILKKTPDGDYIKNTILNRIIQNNKK